MRQSVKYVAGAGLGVAADVAWRMWPEQQQFVRGLEMEQSPLAFVEHYHWGLAALIGGRLTKNYGRVFDGFGSVMIISEAFQSQPFGIGKDAWQVQGNLMLTAFLGSLLVFAWAEQ